MIIENLGHACFRIKGKDISVIFDPYAYNSVPRINLALGLEANYSFISHEHHDHNARELINIKKTDKKLEFCSVLLPHDKENGRLRGFSKATMINVDGVKIVHLGDIGDISNKALLDPFKGADILLCPINGFFTINAIEAYELYKYLGVKVIVPMHYEVKEKGIGYPDGGQINLFKKQFNDILEVKSYCLDVNKDTLKHQTWIFLDYLR